MSVAKPSHRRRTDALSDFITPALRSLVCRPLSVDDDVIARVWRRYLASRKQEDFERLFEHYAPSARAVVTHIARRVKRVGNDDFGTMLSDGFLGLMNCIRRTLYYSPGRFQIFLSRGVRSRVWHEAKRRRWGGEARVDGLGIINSIRATFVAEQGELPTREQIVRELAQRVVNPNVYFQYLDDPQTGLVSFGHSEVDPIEYLEVDQSPDTLSELVEREDADAVRIAMGIAMRQLKGQDRSMLRMMRRGHGAPRIAKALGLAERTVSRRLNGILWELRGNAELAAHLGVVPEPPPSGSPFNWPAIPSTPAKLAG
jgi:DNA-directed RNA polymerase specialized sigma subunit